jgi:hypothetical protein
MRRGWATADGTIATAYAACLFAEDIDDDNARSLVLRPFIGLAGASAAAISRCDTGTDDNGDAYVPTITTKPYNPQGAVFNKVGIMAAALIAKAAANTDVTVTASRDFGLETLSRETQLDPTGSEDQVIKVLDSFSFSELQTFQIKFTDAATPAGTWELNQLVLKLRGEQTA